jgi:membrane dipeptidase
MSYPVGMSDVTGYAVLLDVLRRRNWSDDEIRLLAHGNVLRAMRDMEEVARA